VKGSLKERSSDLIEKKFIQSILEGQYKTNEPLLSERELAAYFSVGRPTVREALQRLERDGWVTIRKGMPAIVNDYWKHGNLMTIVNILRYHEEIPDEFIHYMLELRISLAPTYVKDAVIHHPLRVISLFANLEDLQDDAKSYAIFDWEIQQNLAQLSPNPIYLLIMNSFKDFYIQMAQKYFLEPAHRKITRDYYDDLLDSILIGEIHTTEQVTKNIMEKSLLLWKTKVNKGSEIR
jgi:GntR family negative regulator for fad regulon and positive regulator of fabA